MKQFIKTTLFIVVISAIVVFSKDIQFEVVEGYNHYVNQLASLTISNANPVGF